MTDVKASIKNPWIIHVQAYAVEHPNLNYKDALTGARETYTKKAVTVKQEKGEKKLNPWMEHIKQWKEANPMWKDSMTYKDVLRKCKESYTQKAPVGA